MEWVSASNSKRLESMYSGLQEVILGDPAGICRELQEVVLSILGVYTAGFGA